MIEPDRIFPELNPGIQLLVNGSTETLEFWNGAALVAIIDSDGKTTTYAANGNKIAEISATSIKYYGGGPGVVWEIDAAGVCSGFQVGFIQG